MSVDSVKVVLVIGAALTLTLLAVLWPWVYVVVGRYLVVRCGVATSRSWPTPR